MAKRPLVVAGAGTGKTRALTSRLACLLDRGVQPERILLLTFTRRAADEMLARARDLAGLRGGERPQAGPSTPSPIGMLPPTPRCSTCRQDFRRPRPGRGRAI